MKVRITLKPGYGDRNGVFHDHGDVVDFPDDLALKLLRHGMVEVVRDKPKERAVRKPKEKTAVTTKAFRGEE